MAPKRKADVEYTAPEYTLDDLQDNSTTAGIQRLSNDQRRLYTATQPVQADSASAPAANTDIPDDPLLYEGPVIEVEEPSKAKKAKQSNSKVSRACRLSMSPRADIARPIRWPTGSPFATNS